MPTTAELFDLAVRHHHQGDLAQAEHLYRQILQRDPAHADSLHLLGVLAQQTGHYDAALMLIGQAIALVPRAGVFHSNLGLAHKLQGRFAEAAECFRQALRLNPQHAEAHNNLGSILLQERKFIEASASFHEALRINPAYAEAHYNLALACIELKQLTEARQCLEQVVRLNPRQTQAHYLLGNILFEQGWQSEAIECFRQALRINPDHAEAHNSLGVALVEIHQLTEGAECFRQALRINPDYVIALMNQGNVLRTQGFLDEGVGCYREVLKLDPDNLAAYCNLLYTLYFCPGQSTASLWAEHRHWSLRFAQPLAKFIEPHANDKSPGRRLRIGYLSPDFRIHPIGRFLAPLLEAHDRAHFEIYCYSSLDIADEWTAHCQGRADVWRAVYGCSDEEVARQIRSDRIDILVDLTMHMANSRLLVFVRKPAPVQVTYLAYPGTTGLDTMDYRLTDKYLDPPGQNDRFYSEQSIYLPDSYWCYQEVFSEPATPSPPSEGTGTITFGCLNNYCKVTVPTLAIWSRILQAFPQSRLLLCTQTGSHRDRVINFLAERNVAPERIQFVDFMKTLEYFRTYNRIDIALDPFPYGGGTTTCDALWMGVPVVCLAGPMPVGRGGVSILSNLGLTELLGQDTEDYVRIALEFAGDSERLSELRATLRERLKKSPLMDAPGFARNIEKAYRGIWERWCGE